jgi:hypothetical protein
MMFNNKSEAKMTKLITPTEQLSSLIAMAEILDKKHRDYAVTVVISPEQQSITWIGGNMPNFNLMIFPLEKGHGLKQASFAIPGDFFCQAVNSVTSPKKESGNLSFTTLTFTLDYKNGNYARVKHVEPIRVFNVLNETHPPLRKCETLSAISDHLEYLQANTQRAYHRISMSDINQICFLDATLHSFEYLQLNADTRDIRIQRAGKITTSPLPDRLNLPMTLVFNPATLDEIKRLLRQTDAKEMCFAMEGESITISTPEKTTTKSIAGLNEFISRIQEKTIIEATLIVDIICLEDEIDAQRKYGNEKKRNECYLFIHNNELMILNEIKKPDDFSGIDLSRKVFVKSLISNDVYLYRFHPQDLIDARIAGMRSMKQVKLVITKNSKNDRYIEFYASSNEKLPYAKIPVESEEGNIETAILLKQDYSILTKDIGDQLMPEQRQIDFIGFDGV